MLCTFCTCVLQTVFFKHFSWLLKMLKHLYLLREGVVHISGVLWALLTWRSLTLWLTLIKWVLQPPKKQRIIRTNRAEPGVFHYVLFYKCVWECVYLHPHVGQDDAAGHPALWGGAAKPLKVLVHAILPERRLDRLRCPPGHERAPVLPLQHLHLSGRTITQPNREGRAETIFAFTGNRKQNSRNFQRTFVMLRVTMCVVLCF